MKLKLACLIFTLLASQTSFAAEGKSHHAALFVGATVISSKAKFTTALEYEYRLPFWHGILGVGPTFEQIWSGVDWVLVGNIYVHPYAGFKLFFGPGVKITSAKNNYLTRVGGGYDFHVGEAYSVGPLAAVDFISGKTAGVFGVTVGVGF